MSLITEFSSDFSKAIRSRGADYVQEGRVKITNGSAREVNARVRGERTYRVSLSINGNELSVHCDCPAFETEPCKHLWATILAVEGKGYLRGDGDRGPLEMVPAFVDDYDDSGFYDYDDDDDDDDDESEDEYDRPPLSLKTPGGRRRSKENLPSWKEQLKAIGRAAIAQTAESGEEWPPTRRIIYVIDVQATLESQHLILDALVQDLKQNGE